MTSIPQTEESTNFFMTWKSQPALWNKNSEDYKNKTKRDQALEELLQSYLKVDINANMTTLKQKLHNICFCYGTELKKLEISLAAGKAYSPCLWYFDELSFLKEGCLNKLDSVSIDPDEFLFDDQDVTVPPRPLSNISSTPNSPQPSNSPQPQNSLQPPNLPQPPNYEQPLNAPQQQHFVQPSDVPQQPNSVQPQNSLQTPASPQENLIPNLPPPSSPPPQLSFDLREPLQRPSVCDYSRKRSLDPDCFERNPKCPKRIPLEACRTTRNYSHDKDEASVYAENWGAQFRSLPSIQQIFAKKAIEDIFFMAKLELLNWNTLLVLSTDLLQNAPPMTRKEPRYYNHDDFSYSRRSNRH